MSEPDPRRLDRLRWKARRGLLENDLMLSKFLQATLPTMPDAELDVLDSLLQLGDNELLDLLMARVTTNDSARAVLVKKIQDF